MEQFIPQCLVPLLECSAGTFGVVLKYALLITSAIGTARLIFKPLQPYLLLLVEKTSMTWDNKAYKVLAYVFDLVASIKLPAPK